MNFQPDTLIALAFLAPVTLFAFAELLAVRSRRLEVPTRMSASANPAPAILVDVTARAANDDWMREAA